MVAGVQWRVYLPDGHVSDWPGMAAAYVRNVAADADVSQDWVTVLEAPNTSFTVTTQARAHLLTAGSVCR